MWRMIMRLLKVILNTLQRVPNANLVLCKSWIQEHEYHQCLDHSACFGPSSEDKSLFHTKISTKISFVPMLIICRSHCFGFSALRTESLESILPCIVDHRNLFLRHARLGEHQYWCSGQLFAPLPNIQSPSQEELVKTFSKMDRRNEKNWD